MQPRPDRPKTCPVCLVAMQATRLEDRIVHRCQRCELTITIAPIPKKEA